MLTNPAHRALSGLVDIGLRRHFKKGGVWIRLPGEREPRYYGESGSGTNAPTITIKSWWTILTLPPRGTLGFGDGFTKGHIDADSHAQLVRFLKVANANNPDGKAGRIW